MTMGANQLERWIEEYVRAWGSNDPSEIAELFTDDGRYYTAPHREPWTGRDAIVKGWIDRKDETGNWKFRHEVMAQCDGLSFVRGWTDYVEPPARYSNLWVIQLDSDGRCSEFTEWWMEY
jgi:SnoaL-like protein